jgi:hypothetical protein
MAGFLDTFCAQFSFGSEAGTKRRFAKNAIDVDLRERMIICVR